MLSKFIVLSDPAAGKEAEYNSWYEHQHSRRAQCAGLHFRAAFPFAGKINEVPHWTYCVIYTIDSDNPEAVVEALTKTVADGGMHISAALDPRVYAALYRPAGEEQHAAT